MAGSQPLSLQERTLTPHLAQVLEYAIGRGASDLHVTPGSPPVIRIDSALRSVPNEPPYTVERAAEDLLSTLLPVQQALFAKGSDLDFAFPHQEVRIRTNLHRTRGHVAGSLRIIPGKVADLSALGLPKVAADLLINKQGLIIITGPAGHGKTTSMAAMVDAINRERSEHIITIEDPIEYVLENKKSLITQREVGTDTASISDGLRFALRQDPNVLFVGEMRDLETFQAVLTLAETGHLVFSTLHTNSTAQTPDRIIGAFPPHQQPQVRSQLAAVILAILSQRLLPKVDGGRALATEVLVATSAVRALIRDGKTYQLENVIATGAADGMIGLDAVLATLVSSGEVAIDDALAWANDPKQLKMNVY